MARLTHHDLLQCQEPPALREGHPTDIELLAAAARHLRMQRGYVATKEGIPSDDPGLLRQLIQFHAEREVARYLMVGYTPHPVTKDHWPPKIQTTHGVPVDVLVRKRRVDPKGRASMPELLLPREWPSRSGVAVAYVVWIGDGCAPHLAGWLWEDEIRTGPSIMLDGRSYYRRRVTQLHAMERLVVASAYVPTKQIPLVREVIS